MFLILKAILLILLIRKFLCDGRRKKQVPTHNRYQENLKFFEPFFYEFFHQKLSPSEIKIKF